MKIELSVSEMRKRHSHKEAELVYVKEGTAVLGVADNRIALGREDFYMINSYESHSYEVAENSLLVHIEIDIDQLQEITERQILMFECDTRNIQGEYAAHKYEELGNAIQEIFQYYYRKRPEEKLLLESAYSKTLYYLVRNFAVDVPDDEKLISKEQRADEIEKYLRQHFDKQISLNSLAEIFFLSPAYLSRYFKKELGTNFLDYLNKIRLEHAVEELAQTNKAIAQIAMGVGFPNITAFNKKFRDVYGVTPTEYRNKRNRERLAQEMNASVNETEDFSPPSESYDRFHMENVVMEQVVYVNDSNPQKIRFNWGQMINIGTFAQLMRFNLQNHTVRLHDELHFRYARVWGLYDKELGIVADIERREYNFNVIDIVIDFLLKSYIKPHIELGYKERKVVGAGLHRIFGAEKYDFWNDDELLEDFIHKLIVHVINRYGINEVATWRFEVWAEEEKLLIDKDADQKLYITEFLRKFDIIAGTVKNTFPDAVIGGCGYPCSCGGNTLRSLLKEWEKHTHPDFLSVGIYPLCRGYDMGNDTDVIKGRIIENAYVSNAISRMKMVLQESSLKECALLVTEWNLTVVSQNYINDSALKGAYVMYNLIMNINRVDAMGYWVGTDLSVWHSGMTKCITGAGGLLTCHGIKKPVWYAFDFMNSLKKFLYVKTENYAVTGDGYGSWSIVCHNYTQLNHMYYLIEDGKLRLDEVNTVAKATEWQRYTFMLPCQEKALFRITVYSINSKYGNVLNGWKDMGCPEGLNKEELEYLKSVCVPRMRVFERESAEGRVSFSTELEQNEIQLIQVVKQLV